MADSLATRAQAIVDLWSQLAMRHVSMGGACACGMGGISLRLYDFEADIAGYLEDAGQRCGIAEVEAFFKAEPSVASHDQPVRRLLDEAIEGRLPEVVGDWMFPKIERTLRSVAEQHGQGAR